MAEDYKNLDKEYIVNVYNRVGAVLDHGKGAILYDVSAPLLLSIFLVSVMTCGFMPSKRSSIN